MAAISQFTLMAGYIADYYRHTFWKESAEKVCDDEEDISGKIIIVTGSNTGIGKMAALQLAKRGAVVIMAVRDMKKGQQALEDIKEKLGAEVKIELMKLDLGDLQSIRDFVREFEAKYSQLNILVNNAGFMDTNGTLLKTKDGFEQHIGVNHLGPFLLTRLLMNSLKKGAPSRVICVASTNIAIATLDLDDLMMEKKMKTGDSGKEPYSISKLCNSICIQKYALEMKQDTASGSEEVKILQLCPGYVNSDVFRNERGIFKSIKNAVSLAAVGLTTHQGCETIVYLSTSKSFSEQNVPGRGEMYRFMKLWECGNKLLQDYMAKEQSDKLYKMTEMLLGLDKQ